MSLLLSDSTPFVRRTTPAQIDLYQSLVALSLSFLACTDPHCDMHYQQLDDLSMSLSNCLSHCADCGIPKTGGR